MYKYKFELCVYGMFVYIILYHFISVKYIHIYVCISTVALLLSEYTEELSIRKTLMRLGIDLNESGSYESHYKIFTQ